MTEPMILDRYRIIEQVGRGGYGEVFRAEDTLMNRTVAVKRIDLSDKTSARTLTEARAAGQLNHPNVVTVFDLEHDDRYSYLIMEFIDGVTLSNILQAKSPLSIEESLDIAIQIADALEAAHAMDIVHRDIKPDNIMITKDGNVKVTDFGIARLGASTLTVEGDVLGTFAYMSPEQAKGGRIDARTDVFSLGVVIYEMLTGVSPFASATPAGIVFKITNLDAQPPSEINPGISADLESLILRALEKKRSQRLDDVTIMRHYLESMRSAKSPSHKVIKPLYKLVKSGQTMTAKEYEGPMSSFVGGLADAKESAATWLNRHRSLTNRVINALVATLVLTWFLSKTGFYAGEIQAVMPFAYCAAALLFPRVGLAAGFAILFLPLADYSLIVAVLAMIIVFLWMLSFWLFKPAKSVFAFWGPITAAAGVGLSYPLAAGLLWGPVAAGFIGFLGGLGVVLSDLFNSKTIHFIQLSNSFGVKHELAGSLDPLTAIGAVFHPFVRSPALLLQPLLWAGVAVLISFLSKRRSLSGDARALAIGAGVLLFGELALMTAFHWSPSFIDVLLKSWVASLIIPVGLLAALPRRSFGLEDAADEDDEDDE
jgi:hypothetical protein